MIDVENMTVAELKKAAQKCADVVVSNLSIVRTYSAGVHVGVVSKRDGKEVTLTSARRVWSWKGANTLHEMSLYGIDEAGSRVSEPVASILLTEAIEIIPVTEIAAKKFMGAKWLGK